MAWLASTATALGTAVAVSAVVYVVAGQPVRESAAASSPIVPAATTYEIRAPGSSELCRIGKGPPRPGGLAQITVAAGCGDLFPALAEVEFWEERQDGSIALSGENHDPIVTFAVADGVGYESYWPQAPLLSLAEMR